MVVNLVTGRTLVRHLRVATGFWSRLLGLIPYAKLDAGAGLLLLPCSGIHTCFMRFPIDVAYLDADLRVVVAYRNVRPWRVLPRLARAACVLELPAGTLENTDTQVGHVLVLRLPTGLDSRKTPGCQ